jgi:hypothetical protein
MAVAVGVPPEGLGRGSGRFAASQPVASNSREVIIRRQECLPVQRKQRNIIEFSPWPAKSNA